MNIRSAREDDSDQLFHVLLQFQQETTYRDEQPTDQPTFLGILRGLLSQPDRFGLFVATDQEEIVGVCFGSIGPANVLLPSIKLASEFAWWIHPRVRNGNTGARLLSTFRNWGILHGASVLSYGKPLTSRCIKPGVYREEIIRRKIGAVHV